MIWEVDGHFDSCTQGPAHPPPQAATIFGGLFTTSPSETTCSGVTDGGQGPGGQMPFWQRKCGAPF